MGSAERRRSAVSRPVRASPPSSPYFSHSAPRLRFRLGGEFQVNTYTGDYQSRTGGGGDARAAASSSPGRATRTAACSASSPAVSPARARLWPTSSRSTPTPRTRSSIRSVAAAAAGGFVVVWQSNLQDGSNYGVFARRFSSAGVALGGEFQVNTYTADNQSRPVGGSDSSATSSSPGRAISRTARTRASSPAASRAPGVPSAGEFQVNTYTAGRPALSPSVAASAAGDFVVVWQSYVQDGCGLRRLRPALRQRRRARGQRVPGQHLHHELPVRPIGGGERRRRLRRRLAELRSGRLDGYGIFGSALLERRRSGSPASSRSTPTPRATRRYPSVAADADGDFVVAWQSYDQDGSSYGVFARRFSSAGVPLAQRVPGQHLHHRRPGAAGRRDDASGRFVVAWESYSQDGSGTRRLRPALRRRHRPRHRRQRRGRSPHRWAPRPALPVRLPRRHSGQRSGRHRRLHALQRAGARGLSRWRRFTVGGARGPPRQRVPGQYLHLEPSDLRHGRDRRQRRVRGRVGQLLPGRGLGDGDLRAALLGRRHRIGQRVSGQHLHTERPELSRGGRRRRRRLRCRLAERRPGRQFERHLRPALFEHGDGAGRGVPVNTFTSSFQRQPSVALEGAGGFVVAWDSADQDGSGYGIFARRFSSSGAGLATEFQVNGQTTNAQANAAVAAGSDGTSSSPGRATARTAR